MTHRLLATAILLGSAIMAQATSSVESTEKAFIDRMVDQHDFARAELERLLESARHRPSIIAAISRPAEALPWDRYRRIFLTPDRIAGGVDYWQRNVASLERAQSRYGVPPHVIVAIIGVETQYGANMGSHRVIDALKTLGFGYPKRAEFFRGELEAFLLMTREEGLDPLQPKGSYAGAMGKAQFIPSSFRRLAVDFDGDGVRDLWHSDADAIGSIANYLAHHGWQPDAPIAARTTIEDPVLVELSSRKGTRPTEPLRRLINRQVAIPLTEDLDRKAVVVELPQAAGPEYWLGFENFYAITRYNHSTLYAMAVYQLAEAIRERLAAKEAADR